MESSRKASCEPRDLSHEAVLVEERSSKIEGGVKKYLRGKFLGKGGFAKCYEMNVVENNKLLAAKVIPKSTLAKSRAKQKLMSEIKIHRSLHHNNVVGFEHFFEDHENVYILLEICKNQTLNELLRRRRKLTELEVQCYLIQILLALKYLHSHRVIHRDLKLGNLFLSENMEIKLGDFGLATKLEYDGEKKHTVCGTPNYIAPEILEGKGGHSFEVDIWSLGVVCYTLLIGKPPFETADVKTTYKRIRMNAYSFPEGAVISTAARNLISSILVTAPEKRPTLSEILAHDFLNPPGSVPKLLPVNTLTAPPNSVFTKQYSMPHSSLGISEKTEKKLIESPITKSRVSVNMIDNKIIDNAVAPSRVPSMHTYTKSTEANKQIFSTEVKPNTNFLNTNFLEGKNLLKEEALTNRLNLDANRVNIDLNSPFSGNQNNKRDLLKEKRDFINTERLLTQGGFSNKAEVVTFESDEQMDPQREFQPGGGSSKKAEIQSHPSTRVNTAGSVGHITNRGNENFERTPSAGPHNFQSQGYKPANFTTNAGSEVYVKKWADYSSKYGLGYLLTNGAVGVYFNDSTKILDLNTERFEYFSRNNTDRQDMQTTYSFSDYPQDLHKKVTLLHHFKSFLVGEDPEVNIGSGVSKEPMRTSAIRRLSSNSSGQAIYVKKWMRSKHAILFRLSNKVAQVVFLDQTEIILNSDIRVVTYVNKKQERINYPLATALESDNMEMVKRLKYTKDVLTQMLGGGATVGIATSANKNKLETAIGTGVVRDPSAERTPFHQNSNISRGLSSNGNSQSRKSLSNAGAPSSSSQIGSNSNSKPSNNYLSSSRKIEQGNNFEYNLSTVRTGANPVEGQGLTSNYLMNNYI